MLLRPDKLELLSRDFDKELVLNALETEGERADGELTFETVFLPTLLSVLSNDVEESFFEEEETDNTGFTEGFLIVSGLLTSDPVDDLKLLSVADTDCDFLTSETLDRVTGFVAAEGKELLLSSGRDRLTGSDEAVVLLPATVITLFCRFTVDDFPGTPPVPFLFITGIEFELRDEAVIVGLFTFELESELLFGSPLFLIEPVVGKRLEVAEIAAFVVFPASTELTGDCL